jgi:hypothetical protein
MNDNLEMKVEQRTLANIFSLMFADEESKSLLRISKNINIAIK